MDGAEGGKLQAVEIDLDAQTRFDLEHELQHLKGIEPHLLDEVRGIRKAGVQTGLRLDFREDPLDRVDGRAHFISTRRNRSFLTASPIPMKGPKPYWSTYS